MKGRHLFLELTAWIDSIECVKANIFELVAVSLTLWVSSLCPWSYSGPNETEDTDLGSFSADSNMSMLCYDTVDLGSASRFFPDKTGTFPIRQY